VTPWLAHFYTGLGVVAALLAMLAVLAAEYRLAFLWLGAQIVIDATDGILARALRVKERLPQFDGARLDDIIDYLTYVFIPMVLLLHAGVIEGTLGAATAAVVLLASAYGFSQTAAKVKTSDFFFTGFPSYWNLIALYLFIWRLPSAASAVILLIFAILVFVPLRYVYPSRTLAFATLTNVLGATWALLLVWVVWRLPATDGPWVTLSMVFPVYYMALSFWLDLNDRRSSR
jgi:phosphatidylcholine synthase